MSLFGFFVDLQNNRRKSWIETTATFTGNRNKFSTKTKVGFKELDYYEYEITYNDGKKIRRGFYTFYPVKDPNPDEIKGKTIKIKYNKKKPYQFVAYT